VRFRYRLSPRFSVSLGARASLRRRGTDFSFEYTRREPFDYEDRERVKYSPYLLSARALAVQAGVHYRTPVSRKLTLEAFLAAGPVFADSRYSSDWEYVWHRQGPDMDFDVSPELKIARVNTSGPEGQLSLLDFHYLIGTPQGVEHFTERHELGLFTVPEMQAALTGAGLRSEYDTQGLTGRGLHIGVKPL